MLTITETLDAICSLDTDADIILGACKRYINPADTNTNKEPTAVEIATYICNKYMKETSSEEVIRGTYTALVTMAVEAAKPGHEIDLLNGLLKSISVAYGRAIVKVCHRQMQTDPSGATNRLMTIMADLGKISRG